MTFPPPLSVLYFRAAGIVFGGKASVTLERCRMPKSDGILDEMLGELVTALRGH
jgi:hypothetical protein